MKIKNVILLVVAGITATFYSCDNRKDYFEDLNNAPNLTIRKTGTINVYSASIIDSFNLENLSYSSDYNVTDEKVESIKITSAYNVGSGTTQINLIDKKLIITMEKPFFTPSEIFFSTRPFPKTLKEVWWWRAK